MLMNGIYFEFVGRYLDTYETRKANKEEILEAKQEAFDTENDLYLTVYHDGVLLGVQPLVGREEDYPRTKGKTYEEDLPEELKRQYMMLGRLKADCDYFLNNGNGYEPHLWAGSVETQISEMKRRLDEFKPEDKPEWLTIEMINRYETEMIKKRR